MILATIDCFECGVLTSATIMATCECAFNFCRWFEACHEM